MLSIKFIYFDTIHLGRQFVNAVSRSSSRGVIVNGLLWCIALGLQLAQVRRALKKTTGLITARFLPAISGWQAFALSNLKNHRKNTHIDGEVAYIWQDWTQ